MALTPVTREECYLAKAGGQDVPTPTPVPGEEQYLAKLSGQDVNVPTPITRREKFLYAASGGDIELPSEDKMRRIEKFMAKAGGMDVSTPTAVTRLEKFWANVEAGGWKTIAGVLPLTFTAKGGTAVDWVIYGNAQGVGERTKNFWNPNSKTTNQNGFVQPGVELPAGTYTIVNNSGRSVYARNGISSTDASTWAAPGKSVTKTFKVSCVAWCTQSESNIVLVSGSTAPETYIPYGYQIPIDINQGETDKNYDIYIGDTPLTEGETVSKTSTGVDIELFGGENTVSTTLYNKPEMMIKYKE